METPEFRGFDYVEFYTGSCKMSSYWFRRALGLDLRAWAGPETGQREKLSFFLRKNDFKILLTGPARAYHSDIGPFIAAHGDGVKTVALEAENVEHAYHFALERGGVPLFAPRTLRDDYGNVQEAGLKLFDDTSLVLINHDDYNGPFKPGYVPPPGESRRDPGPDTGLRGIDHIVGNVRINEMDTWVNYLNNCLGFETLQRFEAGDITTRYSALLSAVTHSLNNKIKIPVNEPAEGLHKSQIQEYLEEYRGSGIQHIAIHTNDIIGAVRALRERGMEFLEIPSSYYQDLNERIHVGSVPVLESLEELAELGILCDLEGQGYLLQLFTKPIGDRPTFFFEIIQRKFDAAGFGQGNFQALFEAMERDQHARGNLKNARPTRQVQEK